MIVLPAIDLKDGEAVRLYKGDYNQKTVYSSSPQDIAKSFQDMGADYLHVVDLDGAKDGGSVNTEAIKAIRTTFDGVMELGGGIRDMKTVSLCLDDIGISRVILGTAALKNRAFLEEALTKYGPEKIVVGVDVKNGYVSTEGWLETSDVEYLDFLQELEAMGVTTVVCTDISKDGTLTGPSFDMYDAIRANTNLSFVVSGGVKDDDDIMEAKARGYDACIVGKAFYEGRVHLEEVIERAR